MNRYFTFLFVFLMLIVHISGYAQRKGYILIDTVYAQGYLNYGAENLNVDSIGFSKLFGTTFTYYTPNEIVEYGLNGKTFDSKETGGDKRFFERLYIGERSLYRNKLEGELKYYLENDMQIQELEKKTYKENLKNYFSYNEELKDLVDIVRYKKNSLTRLIAYSNEGTYTYFPYRRFGLTIGNSSRILKFEYRGFNPQLENYFGLTFGAFVDTPIEVYSNWSARFELLFISHKFTLTEENPFIRRDYAVNLNSISLPMLIRHRSYRSDIIPFFEFGAALGFNATANIELIETSFDMGGRTVTEYDLNIIDKTDLGLVAGLGFDYQLKYNKALGLAIRYQFNFGIEGRIDHTIHDLQVLFSFSF